jgi:hypothetical protein
MKISGAKRPLAWALACWAGTAVEAVAGSPVHVQVVDDATGQTVPARAYLKRGDEPLLPAGFSSYARGDERHFLVPRDFELDLEPGKYRLRIERGLEYVPDELDLDVRRSTPVHVRLRRWIEMNGDGWYSADMHVHRDPAEIPLILRAGPQLRAHHNDPCLEHRGEPALEVAASEFPVRVEPNRLFTANAQEVERIQGGPGAVILLAEGLPLLAEGYELYPPAVSYTRKAHAMEASLKATSCSGSTPSSMPRLARSTSSS